MTKDVIVAYGVEAKYLFLHQEIINFLDDKATKVGESVDEITYRYHTDQCDYRIRNVYTKEKFKEALNMQDAIVIYCFHSRYGQGPAFDYEQSPRFDLPDCPDIQTYPQNPWENYFRMGYDFINIPCEGEILKHCTNPTEIPKDLPKKYSASDYVRQKILEPSEKRLKKGSWQRPGLGCEFKKSLRRPLKICNRILADKDIRGEKSLWNRDFWYIQKVQQNLDDDYWTIAQAGAEDLEAVSLKCSVLFMYSCRSQYHFEWALKCRKKATNSKCVFYLTKLEVFDTLAPKIFLEKILQGLDPRTEHDRFRALMNHVGIQAGQIIFAK